MYYLCKDKDERYYVKGATGYTPKDAVIAIPSAFNKSDYPFLKAVPYEDENGVQKLKVEVDEAAKVAALGAETKERLIKEAADTFNSDIYFELKKVFDTSVSETATANHETYKLMKEFPEDYSALGLQVQSKLMNEDGTELYDEGAALDTAEKVSAFAVRKLELAKAYAVYRLQRKKQFDEQKQTILGDN